MKKLALIVGLAGLTAPGASAGPVSRDGWEYDAHITGSAGHNHVFFGHGQRNHVDEHGTGWSEYFMWVGTIDQSAAGRRLQAPGRMSLGEIRRDAVTAYPYEGGGFPIDPAMAVSFVITDRESRESRAVTRQVSALWYTQYVEQGTGLNYFMPDVRPAEFGLGDSIYTVALESEQTANGHTLFLNVRTTPSAPEPGTLVLAGIGLAAVGGAWARRRARTRAGSG